MSFSFIKNNEKLINQIEKVIKQGNLHHAYIIEGSFTTNKYIFAKEFAKAIMCKENESDSCDICLNCQKINNNNHLDITTIEATKAKGSKVKSVKNEDILLLQGRLRKKPFDGDRNIAIINNSDTMSPAAFNSLLKTLEEPPVGTVIMLLTENIKQLPQTIASRAVHLRLSSWEAMENKGQREDANTLVEYIKEGALYYKIKSFVENRDKEDAYGLLDSMEEIYRQELMKGVITKMYIYNAIEAIEKTRNDIRGNITVSNALKNMALTIGNQ